MVDKELLKFFENFLGKSYSLKKQGEYIFTCPFCKHYKKKLQIQLDDKRPDFGHWHCWVCNKSSKGLKILLDDISEIKKVDDIYFQRLNTLLPDESYKKRATTEEKKSLLTLPDEFKSILIKGKSPEYRHAIRYIYSRKLTKKDILRYNLGYCIDGEYGGRIIMPSYDENDNLNFFQGRTFFDNPYKHKNPMVSYDEIIGLENTINWKMPIVITEGFFDAYAIRINCIPSFGKNLSKKLIQKIYKKKINTIYLFMDPDAITTVHKIASQFINNGINVYYVKILKDDPGLIGYRKCQKLIRDSTKLSTSDILKFKAK